MADVDAVDGEVEEAGEAAEAEEVEEAEETVRSRSAETDALWAEVRVDPVEMALPRGVGYTLRAYRMSDEVTPSEVEREEDDFTVLERPDPTAGDDDFDAELDDEADADRRDPEDDEDDSATKRADDEDEATDEADEPDEADFADDEDEEPAAAEEVPIFLGRGGQVYLFENPQALVDFVRSDAEHDLVQLDSWSTVREKISADDVVAADADRYELDLVVENLRGGPDAWDPDLLVRAGEVARDLGYALRIDAVLTALSPGSPLDDLDEALRSASAGGIGGFFARRRLKRIGAQQAALGWRTIIGKISAAVDWRE